MNLFLKPFCKFVLFLTCFVTASQLPAQANWQTLSGILDNTNNQRFDDVFFLDATTGWAVNGFFAAVYKTTDGGVTWTEQLNESELTGDFYFRSISFLNENIGFLGTLNGSFFKTINGGDTWAEVTNITPNPPAICGLNTVGVSTIYGCGAFFSPAHIIKSTDSGETWQFIDMTAYANALVEIYFLTEQTGFASGRSDTGATLLKTTDGGSTWTEIYNTPGEYVWKLQILDPNTPDVIFGAITSVAPHPGKLIKSTNGGASFTSFDAPETDIQAVGFISETRGWMGGHTTGFYETTNGGETWTDINIGSNLNRIFVLSPTLAYGCGTSVYKFSNTNTLSTLTVDIPAQKPLTISLKQNPINSVLEFTIAYAASDNMLIELYDSNGKFIEQLTRVIITSKTTKTYSYTLDHLSTGTYFVNFHYNNGRVSKKFIKN
jgi:photosystem II stability/assembly factor-like uncharacterized protein